MNITRTFVLIFTIGVLCSAAFGAKTGPTSATSATVTARHAPATSRTLTQRQRSYRYNYMKLGRVESEDDDTSGLVGVDPPRCVP
jgi:hypothetical protein